MTKEEIQKASERKLRAIEKFMRQMDVTVSAEQMITQEGIIKTVIRYTDDEKYEVDEPATEEAKMQAPKVEEPLIPNLNEDEKPQEVAPNPAV